LRPGGLVLLPQVCPAGHGLHQLYPVEVLLPAQLRHLHRHTRVLGWSESVVPQSLVYIIWFSDRLHDHDDYPVDRHNGGDGAEGAD